MFYVALIIPVFCCMGVACRTKRNFTKPFFFGLWLTILTKHLQPSAISSNALLPEEIAKEMKTEDQILAQLRASQNIGTPQNVPFIKEQPPATSAPPKLDDAFPTPSSATPNMEELHKLIQKDTLAAKTASETSTENTKEQVNLYS